MTLEELLRKPQEQPEEAPPPPPEEHPAEKRSLIAQLSEAAGYHPEEEASGQTESGAAPAVRCADGYVRLSPVQPYRTMPGYRQRLVRKAVLILLGLALAGLAVYALLQAKLVKF